MCIACAQRGAEERSLQQAAYLPPRPWWKAFACCGLADFNNPETKRCANFAARVLAYLCVAASCVRPLNVDVPFIMELPFGDKLEMFIHHSTGTVLNALLQPGVADVSVNFQLDEKIQGRDTGIG